MQWSPAGNREKIDHVQQVLNVLLDGQAKVTENLRAAERLLHPIRSIPDDILGHIFSFCVYEIYDILTERNAPDSLDSRDPPWTLSQVCRSWRRVALSTATLWRCLSVDFKQCREPKAVRLHQFMLGLHLQRARHCQLTIRLSSTNDVSTHASVPILLTSIHFWRHLRARVPAESLAVFSHYGPYLESLHYLQIRLPIKHDDTVPTIHAFDMAQKLRILDLHSMLCRHFHLPGSGNSLTKLVIQGPFYQHIFSFLSKTPNLESLKLYIEASEPFERLSSPIMMPKLTSLEIAEWNDAAPSFVACFFRIFSAPHPVSLTNWSG
ncbi:hypothetical protein F5146DRAFT_972553 [Armillaria mellea]|nr:hypothetical protein F5146DRAFT_972553 [Armillaria mellea]